METKWFSEVFSQDSRNTGRSYRAGHPDVPVGTPGGVTYVPSGRDSEWPEKVKVGLSPLDQLAEFLNERGNSIKEWRIVDGSSCETWLPIVYRIELE